LNPEYNPELRPMELEAAAKNMTFGEYLDELKGGKLILNSIVE